MAEWSELKSNRPYLITWVSTLVLTLVTLQMVSIYLCYNETRTHGYIIDDYLLAHITPRDISIPLFTITWICIIGGLSYLLLSPVKALHVFLTIICIGVIRCFVMYFVPLESPEGIIPLRDPMLESSFYDDKVLVKDLFFSGHTSNMVVLTLLVDHKWLKRILAICTVAVGCLLLVQHVHYTIDVLAAPVFAYIAFKIAYLIQQRILKQFSVSGYHIKQSEPTP